MKKIIYMSIFIFLIVICCTSKVKAYKIEELEKGYLYEKELVTITQGYDYYPKKLIEFDNGFVITGYIIASEEDKYPYLAYYENDEIKWYEVNEMFKGGEFISGLITNKKLIVIGRDSNNSFICEYSLNGAILKAKVFAYNNIFKFKEIYEDNNKFFITGETKATDFTVDSNGNNVAFVLKTNTSYEIVDKCIFGNNGENLLIDSIEFDNEICLLMKIQGEGLFTYNMNPYKIITCDKRMCLSIDESVELKNPEFLRTDNNKLFAYTCDKMTSKINRISFEKGLNSPKKTTYYTTEKDNIITSFDVKYDEKNSVWCTSVEIAVGEKRSQEYVIRNNKDEIISFFQKETNQVLSKSIYLVNGFIYNLGMEIKYNNWNINLSKTIYIKLKNTDCYFNGISGINETKALNKDTFGTYDGEIKYSFNGFYVSAEGKVYVPLEINISNNSTYNQGLKLVFNGRGILNGIQIESGYEVNEVGNYVLEIYGNNETKYYHFLVEDMINEEEKVNYKKLDYQVNTQEKTINQEKEDNTPITDNNLTWIFSEVFVAIGFSLSFIKFRRRKCLEL